MSLVSSFAAILRLLVVVVALVLVPVLTDHLGITDQLAVSRAADDDDDDDGDDDGDDDDDDDDDGDDDDDDDGDDDDDDDDDGDDDDDDGDDGDDDDGDDDDDDDDDDDRDGGDSDEALFDDDQEERDVSIAGAAEFIRLTRLDREREAALLGNWQAVASGGLSGGRDEPLALVGEIIGTALAPADLTALEALGYVVLEVRMLGSLGIEIVRIGITGSRSPEAEIELLGSRFPTAIFDRQHLFRPATTCSPPDCFFSAALTGLPRGAAGCGAGVRIGMVDAAVDLRFAPLRGQSITVNDVTGRAERAGDHGTAIAALLVGDGASQVPGLLPDAELFAAAVVQSVEVGDGRLPLATASDLLAGLDWLAAQDVVAANVSLTGAANAAVALAVQRLRARGIAVVAAGGNDGPIDAPVFPAAYPEVVGVTAVDRFQRIYRFANRGEHIAFAAPGVAVWTGTGPSGSEQTGTSFAAPWVTAIVAAELRASGDELAAVLARLAAESVDLGAPGPDPIFGYGLVRQLGACQASG